MERTRTIVREEKQFLRLCSESYRKMVLGEQQMTFNDYNRICCALGMLELFDYYIYFNFRYGKHFEEELSQKDRRKREYELQYSSGDNLYAELDTEKRWMREFWNQIPSEFQKEKYKELFWIDWE